VGPQPIDFVWAVVIGSGSFIAHYSMTRAMKLGDATLVFSDATARAGALQTFVLRPRPAGRKRLNRRTRARLAIVADVMHPGGKRTQLSRSFRVRK
jgi:hypothetical protein